MGQEKEVEQEAVLEEMGEWDYDLTLSQIGDTR